jgi:Tol biopolymer transport system component/DNA-binding winged helix-turn-helix (wHTH) protein
MPDQVGTSQVIRFATFEVDLQAQELRKAGLRLKLSGQPFQVLAILLEQPGVVVTREALQKRLWPDTFVDVDHNLNTAINKIREALGDSSENPRFVETLPRRGYRFIGSISGNGIAATAVSNASEDRSHRGAEPAISRRVYALASLGVLVLLAAGGLWIFEWRKSPTAPHQRTLTRLTFHDGLQIGATWSPDGRYIAYSSDRGGKFDIWVQQVSGGDPIQITKRPGHNWQPDWSPDGKYIAYRSEQGEGGLYVVPALGGVGMERRIAAFGHYPRWSPDGTQILFRSKFALLDERDKIYVVRLDGSAPTPILSDFAIQHHVEPISVAWHPDGRRVTVWGWSMDPRPKFWTVSMDGSSVTKSEESAAVKAEFSKMSTESELAAFENLGNPRFAWASSGSAIYCSIYLRGVKNLWKLMVDPQTLEITGMERLTTGPGPDDEIALSPDGKRAAFTSKTEHVRIWLLPFNATHGKILGPGKPVTSTSISAVEHILSPDGTKLAFIGERAGKRELWEASLADGRQSPVIVDGYSHTYPIWSPDSTQLVDSRVEFGKDSVQVMIRSAADRIEQPVTSVLMPIAGINRAILVYDWSRDGKQLLISRRNDETRRMEVWEMPIAAAPRAETAARKIAADPGYDLFQPHFSPNGRWIVFQAVAKPPAPQSALYVISAGGGAWTRVTEGNHWDDKPNWSPDGKTIYFVSGRGGGYNVWGIRFDPLSGNPVGQSFQVSRFESPRQMVPQQIPPVALSITKDQMALTLGDSSGGIWVLDNVDR